MYFEPSKRTYYRFPSTNSVHDLDLRYYFPEKPHASGDDMRYETISSNDSSKHDDIIQV